MDLQQTIRFQSYLLPGERILWTGRPRQGVALHRQDAFLLPFGLLWLVFVILFFATFPITQTDGDLTVIPFALLFFAAGIYFTFGRLIHDAAIRKRTSYAVTDQRVLFARGTNKLTSLDLQRLPKLELTEHRDGTGTISFDSGPHLFDIRRQAGLDMWVPSLAAPNQFFKIPDPRKVYQLIRDNAARI